MVQRYVMTEYPHECYMEQDDAGLYVLYEDYAALQAENERLKAVVEAVRAESKSWLKSSSPYMHSCCREAIDELCEEIHGMIDAHKGE